ncbi:MAG: GntR family transcriptional regulator [Oscillospiraceae bacterium]|nr:GntR family transcriptional regulator [Oscillospiraceae bacterium]
MISLDSRDARPIYEQVKDGLRHLMITGALQAGDQLPSVRTLAATLAINPTTIQRAYDALEKEGYLQSVAGKGSFAAPQDAVHQSRRTALLKQFDDTTAELLFLGLTRQELSSRIQEVHA